jgi:hypothetical protein
MVVALLALVMATTASAVAAIRITHSSQLARGVVTGRAVKNRTLTRADLNKRTLKALAGRRGKAGPRGLGGATGPIGPIGPSQAWARSSSSTSPNTTTDAFSALVRVPSLRPGNYVFWATAATEQSTGSPKIHCRLTDGVNSSPDAVELLTSGAHQQMALSWAANLPVTRNVELQCQDFAMADAASVSNVLVTAIRVGSLSVAPTP